MPNRMGSITLKVSNKLILKNPPNHSLLFSFGVNSLKSTCIYKICSGKIPHSTALDPHFIELFISRKFFS